jgi:hypothetical protein
MAAYSTLFWCDVSSIITVLMIVLALELYVQNWGKK